MDFAEYPIQPLLSLRYDNPATICSFASPNGFASVPQINLHVRFSSNIAHSSYAMPERVIAHFYLSSFAPTTSEELYPYTNEVTYVGRALLEGYLQKSSVLPNCTFIGYVSIQLSSSTQCPDGNRDYVSCSGSAFYSIANSELAQLAVPANQTFFSVVLISDAPFCYVPFTPLRATGHISFVLKDYFSSPFLLLHDHFYNAFFCIKITLAMALSTTLLSNSFNHNSNSLQCLGSVNSFVSFLTGRVLSLQLRISTNDIATDGCSSAIYLIRRLDSPNTNPIASAFSGNTTVSSFLPNVPNGILLYKERFTCHTPEPVEVLQRIIPLPALADELWGVTFGRTAGGNNGTVTLMESGSIELWAAVSGANMTIECQCFLLPLA